MKSVLDPSLDTLILAECVLAYLSPESSSKLLQHLSTLLDRPFAICYEMCVAGDDASETAAQPSKFGTVMLSNLQVRCSYLMSTYPSPHPLANVSYSFFFFLHISAG